MIPTKKVTRLRKVYYAYYDDPTSLPHPLIRIAGKYLENFGFAIGDAIEVNLSEHEITIKKVLNPSNTPLIENT